jgi:hypothetical protein
MSSGPVPNLKILEAVWQMRPAKDKAELWDETPAKAIAKRCRGEVLHLAMMESRGGRL